jgi:hypothetical protein
MIEIGSRVVVNNNYPEFNLIGKYGTVIELKDEGYPVVVDMDLNEFTQGDVFRHAVFYHEELRIIKE